jgi:hypothetical protein
MKKLFLLLFISILSYSQISYKDVMSINSEDTFKKVVIENGYEFNDIDEEGWITYGFNIERDAIEGNKSSKWGAYNKNDGKFTFQFNRRTLLGNFLGSEDDTSKNRYDLIVKDIKEKCKYYKIINYNGIDYVTYSCSESSYKGKIGFVVSEGSGIIRHFPTKE